MGTQHVRLAINEHNAVVGITKAADVPDEFRVSEASSAEHLEEVLNRNAQEGWSLVALEQIPGPPSANRGLRFVVIARRSVTIPRS